MTKKEHDQRKAAMLEIVSYLGWTTYPALEEHGHSATRELLRELVAEGRIVKAKARIGNAREGEPYLCGVTDKLVVKGTEVATVFLLAAR